VIRNSSSLASGIRVLLGDGAVHVLDHVLHPALDCHLPTFGLCGLLGVVSVARTLVTLRAVLPLPVLVVRLDVALRRLNPFMV
jgi:hypothetical protein